jgi:hypothetical protein
MSLSPLPETVKTTISSGLKVPFSFFNNANACADSIAGIIPSNFVNSKAHLLPSLMCRSLLLLLLLLFFFIYLGINIDESIQKQQQQQQQQKLFFQLYISLLNSLTV